MTQHYILNIKLTTKEIKARNKKLHARDFKTFIKCGWLL